MTGSAGQADGGSHRDRAGRDIEVRGPGDVVQLALLGTWLAWSLGRLLLGWGAPSGTPAWFSVADAPAGPSGPSIPGLAGVGPAPGPDPDPGPGDPDDGPGEDPEPADPPDEGLLDFLDDLTWTALKGMLPGMTGPGIDLLEGGPTMYDTVDKIHRNHQDKRDVLDKDYRGDAHLKDGQ